MDDLNAKLDWLIERQRQQEELFTEMTPILRAVMATATDKLDDLEKRGWFDTARAAAGVAERVLDHYTAEDVRALGDAIVSILDTVRALTQPDVLTIAAEAANVLAHGDEAKPLGLIGMVRASHKKDVQKGMAVMMEVMRHVGRAAQSMVDKHQEKEGKKAKLAELLGPRRKRALGIERTAPKQLPAHAAGNGAAAHGTAAVAARAATAATATRAATARAATATAATAKAATAAAPVTMIDGFAFNPDGHLADPSQWTRDLAENVAAVEGVPLTPERWKLVEVARADFEDKKAAPNIRRLTQISGLSTKQIFALFPKAPGRTIARIAGTPKPAGCI